MGTPEISGHKGPPLQDQGPLQDVRPSGRCRTSGRWPLQDLRPSGRDQPLGVRPARRIQASMGRLVLLTARALASSMQDPGFQGQVNLANCKSAPCTQDLGFHGQANLFNFRFGRPCCQGPYECAQHAGSRLPGAGWSCELPEPLGVRPARRIQASRGGLVFFNFRLGRAYCQGP